MGGHYPIDVLASLVLGGVVLAAIWWWPVPQSISAWLVCKGPKARVRQLLLFLWIVELGWGFRATEFLVSTAAPFFHRF